jgi:hypothetical protein
VHGHISGAEDHETKFEGYSTIFNVKLFGGDNYFFATPDVIPEVKMATVTTEGARGTEHNQYSGQNQS